MEYGKDYFGFVYIWYNRAALHLEKQDYEDRHHRKPKKHPRLYIGSHYGPYTDGYVCSSRWMLASYKRNPSNFIRRILYFQATPDRQVLLDEEAKWLAKIHSDKLAKGPKVKFYNMNNRQHSHWAATSNAKTVGEKISLSNKGKKHTKKRVYTEEGLLKIKLAAQKRCLRLSSPMKGRNHSEESKNRMKESRLKFFASGGKSVGKKGNIPWNKGNGTVSCCLVCKVRFVHPPCQQRKYCSHACYNHQRRMEI